jgi:predicted cobalt transporter CbtA
LCNPFGLFYVVASALPSTLGANAGLLSLPSMMRRPRPDDEERAGPIARSLAWVAAGAVASLLFVLVLGRGITWPR